MGKNMVAQSRTSGIEGRKVADIGHVRNRTHRVGFVT